MPEHNKYLFADISKNENFCLFSISCFSESDLIQSLNFRISCFFVTRYYVRFY